MITQKTLQELGVTGSLKALLIPALSMGTSNALRGIIDYHRALSGLTAAITDAKYIGLATAATKLAPQLGLALPLTKVNAGLSGLVHGLSVMPMRSQSLCIRYMKEPKINTKHLSYLLHKK